MNKHINKKLTSPDEAHVEEYDQLANEYGWYGPDLMFGLVFRYVEPGQSILAIGVGTGLGTLAFHKCGLKVHGMDVSPEMLEVCKRRGIFATLTQHDLTELPYPFDQNSFDNAVSVGVLNFFKELDTVFCEVARITRESGTFGFTVADMVNGESHEIVVPAEKAQSGADVTIYRHGKNYVSDALDRAGFRVDRDVLFVAYMDRKKSEQFMIRAYAAKKLGASNSS